jgi:hypothetical protein
VKPFSGKKQEVMSVEALVQALVEEIGGRVIPGG